MQRHTKVVAGATGVLGAEVLRRLAGSGYFAHIGMLVVAGESCEKWPPLPEPADIGLVMFEPPRLYYDRERALWTPAPDQLPELTR